ncbi:MAG TPA: VTT domain-containing protein [Methylomirabilota bacterium]|nr:VTT domain-containing protein [Methylomirabilota bacterium]
MVSRANRFVVGPRVPAIRHRRHVALAIAGGIFLVAFNIAVYLAPIDYSAFTSFAYVGAFVVTFLANALIVIPIPYIPIVAHIGATAGMPWLVVVLGALASVLGESVAFLAGRAEEGLVSEHPVYRRVHRVAQRPLLAGAMLFAFAVPPNPIFDVAGLAAGAVGVRYRVFFIAVFAARLIRLAVIVWLGTMLGLVSVRP